MEATKLSQRLRGTEGTKLEKLIVRIMREVEEELREQLHLVLENATRKLLVTIRKAKIQDLI